MEINDSWPLQYVLVLGYGWSGSSAVVDLLNEVDGFFQVETEFRLIKDPHGIMDLRKSVAEHWDALNSDYAIREFNDFIKFLYRNGNRFRQGLAYNKIFGSSFLETSDKYVNRLIDFKYRSIWWLLIDRMSFGKLLWGKILHKFHICDYMRNFEMYFAKQTIEDFDAITRKYLNEIFAPLAKQKHANRIILDQAVPVQNVMPATHFFDSAKVIVVDRDPRDIYVDLINGKNLIGKDLAVSHNTEAYVKWHNAWRDGREHMFKKAGNVLFLYFEDLILQYEQSVAKIFEFLGVDSDKHIHKKEYFKPEESCKNIGLWKKYKNEAEISLIYEALKSQCVQGI